MSDKSVIGVFDSGVGGLSVLRHIWRLLPHEDCIFIADQAHVPYGPRPMAEVRAFSESITRYLLEKGAKLIVVACNTASAAALHYLRKTFPDTLFVGMEPAVKPAAETTQSGKAGVLATPATFQGALYASVVERFAGDVKLYQHTCPGLVQQIEAGALHTLATHRILEHALTPMLAEGIDTVVLGCTHYPFVIPLIEEVVGPGVRVIDPAPAVARQVTRLLDLNKLNRPPNSTLNTKSSTQFLTTGPAWRLESLLSDLLDFHAPVHQLQWDGDGDVEGEFSLIARN